MTQSQPTAPRPKADRAIRAGTKVAPNGAMTCRRCGGVVSMAVRECPYEVTVPVTRYLVSVAPVIGDNVAVGLAVTVESDHGVVGGATIDRRETQPDGTTVVARWRVTECVAVTEQVTGPCGQRFGRFLVSAAKRRAWQQRVLRKLASRDYVPAYLRDAVAAAKGGKQRRALYRALIELRSWHAINPAPLPGRERTFTHPLIAACRARVLQSERAVWS